MTYQSPFRWLWSSSKPQIPAISPIKVHELSETKAEGFVNGTVKIAASPCGRYLFVLGTRQQIHLVELSVEPEYRTSSFKLDVIDLWLDERMALSIDGLSFVGNFVVSFYAIDHQTCVIVDHNYGIGAITQRIVRIDRKAKTAGVPLERRSTCVLPPLASLTMAIGKRICAMVTRDQFDTGVLVTFMPKNPLVNVELPPEKEINNVINETMMECISSHRAGFTISDRFAPFFIDNDSKLVFFGADTNSLGFSNLLHVAWVDLKTKIVDFRPVAADRVTGFPMNASGTTPLFYDCRIRQNGSENVTLYARFHQPCSIIRRAAQGALWSAAHILVGAVFNWFGLDSRVSCYLIDAINTLLWLRSLLSLPTIVRLGTLNTRTWRWAQICEEVTDLSTYQVALSSDNGQLAIFTKHYSVGNFQTSRQVVRVLLQPGSGNVRLKDHAMHALLRDNRSAVRTLVGNRQGECCLMAS